MKQSFFNHGAVRDLRLRQVKVMLAAVVIAVATVAAIQLYAGHLQSTLTQSASAFLAADRQLISRTSQPVTENWRKRAQQSGLQISDLSQFSTMLSANDRFQLTSVKAVDSAYPLRGDIEWQSASDKPRQLRTTGPSPGEIWLNPRLLALLGIHIGDTLKVGNQALKVSGLLIRGPDSSFRLSSLAPQAMMHLNDVTATGVVQPGSRIRHKLLLAGELSQLATFENQYLPDLDPEQYRWRDGRSGDNVAESLQRAESFLMLGGSLAILLAAVAIAVASREYALSQRDTVALLKTLGLTGKTIGQMYLLRLAFWAVIAVIAGLLAGLPFAVLLSWLTAKMMVQPLVLNFQLITLVPAIATAILVLFAFAMPPILRLRQIPAMQVLRSQVDKQKNYWLISDIALAVIVIFALLWWFSNDLKLVLGLLLGLTALVSALALFGWLLVNAARRFASGKGVWRAAIVALSRHRRATLSQLTVFAIIIMLAGTLLLVRTALLTDWQQQLPDDAPNHFLINIAPEYVGKVTDFLAQNQLQSSPLYPMVRGRLTEINGKSATAVAKNPDDDELRRELNLTAASDYPADNKIIAGQWFTENATAGLSIEQSLAQSLGIELNDELGFTIGGETIRASVTSIRSVQWDSMQPNFFIMFPENGALSDQSATFLTSFYLDPDNKVLLNDFVRQFPTISVLEIDHIIEQIQAIISQVTLAIEAILFLIMLAAVAVMVAVVSATMQERQREGALMRTLGARQQFLVRASMLEFALIGLLSGILGVLAAEAAVWALQYRVFEGTFRWHWPLLVLMPLVSSITLALLGRWQLKPVLTVSPMLLLRRLE